ncbi:MAG: exopolysaccharide Pel transporter PelG [Verrucomicrobiae bacterium]|nr:exopolysaccharide Pel transporter PelG [Verrucomicrobiae bacterium]
MAGIGFELQKIMGRKSLTGVTRAGLYAGLIAVGPWMVSVGSLIVLVLMLRPRISAEALDQFTSLITHCYALALLLIGPFSLLLTRYAADRFYDGCRQRILGSYLFALAIMIPIAGGVGILLFSTGGSGLTALQQSSAVALLLLACGIFTAGSYLTSVSRYRWVLMSFSIGFVASCGFVILVVHLYGEGAALAGFVVGHAVLFLLLFWRLAREFGGDYDVTLDVLSYVRRYPELVWAGMFYNCGLWVDKVLFWQFSAQSFSVSGWIKASPEYDLAIHIALATMVPGMAAYVLALETSFATSLQRYREAVSGSATLHRLEELRVDAVEGLKSSMWTLIKVQGLTTLLVFLNLDAICDFLGIGAIARGVFVVTLLGCFLLVIFLSLLTVLFYLDDRKGALRATFAFFAVNASMSALTLIGQESYYGIGFVAGAATGLVVAFLHVSARLESLHRYLFVANTVG